METKKIFVTVGTTKFPKLVDTLTTKNVLETIVSLGYNFMQIQTGKDFSRVNISGDISPSPTIKVLENSTIVNITGKIIIKYDPYFEDFQKEVKSSHLVISHAGAGSCLEVLRQQKPLIVVVNEDLMDNHQAELAEQLHNDGYVYSCTCSTLSEVLKNDILKLRPYPQPDKFLFPRYLDKCMGFVD